MPQEPERTDSIPHARGRIVLADDQELMREGIAAVIMRESDFAICGVAGDEKTTLELMAQHRPDMLLIDLSISHRDGLVLLQELVARFPNTRILALAAYAEARHAERALCLGASGYLIKSASGAELMQAVRSVAKGEIYIGARLGTSGLASGGRCTIVKMSPSEIAQPSTF